MRDKLIENFLRISKIPRMSGKEKLISDFFVDVAKKNNLYYFQDDNYNLIIRKKGNIKGDMIALQAHFDMVCVKTNESTHNFDTDGIDVIIDGDKVTAKDTTLGADQGMGLMLMLTLMEDNTIKHPDLEFLFTVEEETTFKGAITFPYDKVLSKKLINLDYCKDDALVTSSAGDTVNEYVFKSKLINNSLSAYKIIVDGFPGGNSGENIKESENNAITEVARLLKDKEVYITSINGGTFENDLATSCEVVLHTYLDINSIFSKYKIEKYDSNYSFSLEDTNNIINEILSLKGGFLSNTLSANLGLIKTSDNEIKIDYLIRSTDINEIEYYSNQTKELKYNFVVNKLYSDSVWLKNNESKLSEEYKKTYFELYHEYPKEMVGQGGLECASINKRTTGIDIISVGANISKFHTTDEVTFISSWEKIYKILIKLIA